MKSNAECLKPGFIALATVTNLLSACATVSSEPALGVCPPVVEYDAGFQAQMAEEVETLPDDSTILEMLSDYAVMRAQGQICRQ